METVQLQGVGRVPAKAAGELQAGDTVIWNYGSTSTVFNVQECSKCFVKVTMNDDERKFKKTRLVGVKS